MTSELKILPPYKGNKPYIFVSYCHRNSTQVLNVVDRMQKDGYRIWYDEGIDPGTEWDENIAQHVEQCGCFVAFLSRAYLQSTNCKDELNYARELDKPRLLVYLEDVELPGGMRMRLGRLQAVHRHKYPDQRIFFEKLYEFPSLGDCKEAKPVETPKPVEPAQAAPKVPPMTAAPVPPKVPPVAPAQPRPVPPVRPAAPAYPQQKPVAATWQPGKPTPAKKPPKRNVLLMLCGLALAACVVTAGALLLVEDGMFFVSLLCTALMGIPSGALVMKGNGKGHVWPGALLFAAFLPLQLAPMFLSIAMFTTMFA